MTGSPSLGVVGLLGNPRRFVSDAETLLSRATRSYSLLPMSSHRVPVHAGFRLALIGVHAHAVSDVDCR